MLSLSKCRALLPKSAEISDDEMERLRAELYVIADAVVRVFEMERAKSDAAFANLTDDELRIETAERAAIIEFDGQMPRDLAERAALTATINRKLH